MFCKHCGEGFQERIAFCVGCAESAAFDTPKVDNSPLRKRTVMIVAMVMLLVALSGCGRSTNPLNENQLAHIIPEEILAFSAGGTGFDFAVTNVTVDRRQTIERVDMVYAIITMDDGNVQSIVYYVLTLNYYDVGGWMIDDWRSYNDRRFYPLRPPSEHLLFETLAHGGHPGAVLVSASAPTDVNRQALITHHSFETTNTGMFATQTHEIIVESRFEGSRWHSRIVSDVVTSINWNTEAITDRTWRGQGRRGDVTWGPSLETFRIDASEFRVTGNIRRTEGIFRRVGFDGWEWVRDEVSDTPVNVRTSYRIGHRSGNEVILLELTDTWMLVFEWNRALAIHTRGGTETEIVLARGATPGTPVPVPPPAPAPQPAPPTPEPSFIPRNFGGITITIGNWWGDWCTDTANPQTEEEQARLLDRIYIQERNNVRIREVRLGNREDIAGIIFSTMLAGVHISHIIHMDSEEFALIRYHLDYLWEENFEPLSNDYFSPVYANWHHPTIDATRVDGVPYGWARDETAEGDRAGVSAVLVDRSAGQSWFTTEDILFVYALWNRPLSSTAPVPAPPMPTPNPIPTPDPIPTPEPMFPREVWRMSTCDIIQGLPLGLIDEHTDLWPSMVNSGESTISIVASLIGTNAIELTNRGSVYYGLDVILAHLHLQRGLLYRITFSGRMAYPSGSIFIAQPESPWGVESEIPASASWTVSHDFTLASWNYPFQHSIRIQQGEYRSDGWNAPAFILDEVIITAIL